MLVCLLRHHIGVGATNKIITKNESNKVCVEYSTNVCLDNIKIIISCIY